MQPTFISERPTIQPSYSAQLASTDLLASTVAKSKENEQNLFWCAMSYMTS